MSNVVKLVPGKTGRGAKRQTKTREIVYDAWKPPSDGQTLEEIHEQLLLNSVDDKGHSDMLPQIRVPQGTMGQIDEIVRFYEEWYRTPQDFVRTAIHRAIAWHHELLRKAAEPDNPKWRHAWNATSSILILTEYEQTLARAQHARQVLARAQEEIQAQIDTGARAIAYRLALQFDDHVSTLEEFGSLDEEITRLMRQYADWALAETKADAIPSVRPKKPRLRKNL